MESKVIPDTNRAAMICRLELCLRYPLREIANYNRRLQDKTWSSNAYGIH